MDGREPGSPQIIGMVVIGLLLGTLLLQEPSLRGSRPSVSEESYGILGPTDKVRARLWEDPFEDVTRDTRQHSGTVGEQEKQEYLLRHSLRTVLAPRDPTDESEHTVVLSMVRTAPYAEDQERRIRTRYALTLGLSRLGILPSDSEHLGYALWRPPDCAACRLQVIPVETFEDKGTPGRRVTVMWLDQGSYAGRPFCKLATLVEAIRDALWDSPAYPSVVVFGPGNSTRLGEMARELTAQAAPGHKGAYWEALNGVDFYTVRATASPSCLFSNDCKNNEAETLLGDHYRQLTRVDGSSGRFLRVLRDDGKLVEALHHELCRRGVHIHSEELGCPPRNVLGAVFGIPQHIALVLEGDTDYGRSLAKQFETLACQGVTGEDCTIHTYFYLRGIDGKTPKSATGDEDGGSSSATNGGNGHNGSAPGEHKQNGKRQSAAEVEMPVGRGQGDYLRRLSNGIAMHDRKLRQSGEGQVTAVGVLGSDVYDKLLVLKALRTRLSDVLFFTTDLDTRYLHPRQYPWTRNLIIASSFGLQLNHDLQGALPPLRDGYQTGMLLSVLLAFGKPTQQVEDQKGLDTLLGPPRLFEIGADEAVELTVSAQAAEQLIFTAPDFQGTVHPEREAHGWPLFRWAFALLALFLGLALFGLFILQRLGLTPSETWKKTPVVLRRLLKKPWLRGLVIYFSALTLLLSVLLWLPKGGLMVGFLLITATIWWLMRRNPKQLLTRVNGWFLLALPVVPVLMLVYLRLFDATITQGDAGEPWGLFTGVSIWVPQLIRLAAGLLAIGLMVWGFTRLRANEQEISARFSLTQPPTPGRKRCKRARWCRPGVAEHTVTTPHGDQVLANDLWKDYLRHRNFFHFRTRWTVLLPALLFYELGFTVIYLLDDLHLPFRGHWSLYINFVVMLGFTVPAFVLLLFWVVEETRLCIGWIRQLSAHESLWPNATPGGFGFREPLNNWLDVNIIAQRTEVVGSLVRYPFMVLFLMLLSQSTLFDNFQRPLGLVVVILASASYVLYCALALNRIANQARDHALERMQNKLIAAQTQRPGNRNSDTIQRLQSLIGKVEGIHEGAFRAWMEKPVFRAILWILGTAGMMGYSVMGAG